MKAKNRVSRVESSFISFNLKFLLFSNRNEKKWRQSSGQWWDWGSPLVVWEYLLLEFIDEIETRRRRGRGASSLLLLLLLRGRGVGGAVPLFNIVHEPCVICSTFRYNSLRYKVKGSFKLDTHTLHYGLTNNLLSFMPNTICIIQGTSSFIYN